MKKMLNGLSFPALLAAIFAMTILAGDCFGQQYAEVKANFEPATEKRVENDDKGDVQLLKCLPAKNDETPVGRTPFVKQVSVSLNGSGTNVFAMQIPAGKRLVIEDVSVIVRSAQSQRVEVKYDTYASNGGAAQKTVHELMLEKRANFKDSAIFAARQKGIVFADERIGGEHFSVGVSARLLGASVMFAQAQFTFSGYLEDLKAD